jgi:hypothetical protein
MMMMMMMIIEEYTHTHIHTYTYSKQHNPIIALKLYTDIHFNISKNI